MALIVYSQSRSFEAHINAVVDAEVVFRSALSPAAAGTVCLIHAASYVKELPGWLESACEKGVILGVASDNPQLAFLLNYTQLGVRAYFNSYMSAAHYVQMIRLLGNGQSWYPPALLGEAFDLARSAIQQPNLNQENPLIVLTKREREVALAVAEGKTNKLVANTCNMAERTVKAHLTQIFKKLQVKDRVALVIYLNQFDSLKLNRTNIR